MFLSGISATLAAASTGGLLALLTAAGAFRLRRRLPHRRVVAFAAAWIALIALATGGVIASLRARAAETPWPRCRLHARQISIALALYALDHADRYPPDLATPAHEMQLPPQLFVCPYSRRTPDPSSPPDTWSDYRYNHAAAHSATPGAMLACRPENHGGEGTYVLFNDFHLLWVPANE